MTDWQDTIMRNVETRNDRNRQRARRDAPYPSEFEQNLQRTHLFMDISFIKLLDMACRRRNVNRSSYMRRAIALLIASDLQMTARSVLFHSPSQGRYGQHQDRRGARDDGEGIEDWCPHPGCDGEHLRG